MGYIYAYDTDATMSDCGNMSHDTVIVVIAGHFVLTCITAPDLDAKTALIIIDSTIEMADPDPEGKIS